MLPSVEYPLSLSVGPLAWGTTASGSIEYLTIFPGGRIPLDRHPLSGLGEQRQQSLRLQGKRAHILQVLYWQRWQGAILALPFGNPLHRSLYTPLPQTTSPFIKCGQLEMLIKTLPNSIFSLHCPLGTTVSRAVAQRQAFLSHINRLNWLWTGPRFLFPCEDSGQSCVLWEGHWYVGTIWVIYRGIMATYSYTLLVSSRPVEAWLPIFYFVLHSLLEP